MSNTTLSELFIYVAGTDKANAFKNNHVSKPAVLYADVVEYNTAKGTSLSASDFAALPDTEKTKTAGNTIPTSDAYYNKIAFLAETQEIVTHGQVFATNMSGDIQEVSQRVEDIEKLINADGGTIDKLQEVLDWFNGVTAVNSEDSVGAALIADVAANKQAIGTKGTAAVLYADVDEYNTAKGESLSADEFADLPDTEKTKTAAVEGTGLYKEIADAISESNDAINALDVTDAAVDGKYVSAVSQEDGKITVTRADLPTLSVKTGSEDYVAVDNHQVEIKTTNLGDAVGLTKVTEGENAGKWVAADGSVSANPGLATAADVVAEIVADEKVIASALNDHESRISANETAIGKKAEGENAATGLYKEIADAKAAANAAHNTIAEKTTGHVTVSSSTDASTGSVTYTISEDDIASAAVLGKASTGDKQGDNAATGVIAQVEALENWTNNLWEDYTAEQA